MLGHLVLVEHRADRERDLGGAAQRIALAGDGGLNAGEIALGGGEQVFALAGALGGEIGVAADHQPLAGKIGSGDAGHVALVEQRELQAPLSSSALIAGARSAVIQSRPADLMSSVMRA